MVTLGSAKPPHTGSIPVLASKQRTETSDSLSFNRQEISKSYLNNNGVSHRKNILQNGIIRVKVDDTESNNLLTKTLALASNI